MYHCYGKCEPDFTNLHCAQLGLPQCGGCRVYQAGHVIAPHYPVPALREQSVLILELRLLAELRLLGWAATLCRT
jgi:hypothetical protein